MDHVKRAVRSLAPAAGLLGSLAIVEVLAFGPVSAWTSTRLWLVQLSGTATAVMLASLLAWGVARLARSLNRPRVSAADLALCGAASASSTAHTWYFLARRLEAVAPWLPGYAAILGVIGLTLAGSYVALRLLGERFGLPRHQIVASFAGVLAAPILLEATVKTGITPADRHGLRLAALSLTGLLLTAVAIATFRAGRRCGAVVSVALALAILALRIATINPHDLRILHAAPSAKAHGPPILLIVLDTFRGDALDLRDATKSRTPHMARLARQSDVYTGAVANASWTLPGHASILTGRLLSQHRTDITSERGYGFSLDPAIPTAHELFARAGNRTVCIVANPVVSPHSNLVRGCQRYLNPGRLWIMSLLPLKLLDLISIRITNFMILPQVVIDVTGENIFPSGREVVDAALAELPPEPHSLYLFLNFMDTHPPYPPSPRTPLRERLALLRDIVLVLGVAQDMVEFSRRHSPTFRPLYDAQVAQLDREIGRLLDALRERGWYDRMLIVLTSDHGEAFREKTEEPYYFGHQGAFEPAVRIPLLIKRPGQRTGAIFRELVQQADILPTLLAEVGLPAPPGVYGAPLGTHPKGVVVTEWNPLLNSHPHALLPFKRNAIYSGPYKYVREERAEHLYDLQQAPYETVDVIQQQPDLAAALGVKLAEVLGGSGPGPARHKEMDALLLERLRSLGYVK